MDSVPKEHVNPPAPSTPARPLTVAEAKARLLDTGAEPWSEILKPIVRTAVEKTAAEFLSRLFTQTRTPPEPKPQSEGRTAQPKTADKRRTKEETRAWNVRQRLSAASRDKAVGICIYACEVAMSAWRRDRARKRQVKASQAAAAAQAVPEPAATQPIVTINTSDFMHTVR
ncbi:MAG: hypothetical protein H7210_08210 [Pyrinomonadaceae bacterium]|nr:hypothetical protein [Phycisphaerales bacterium]